MLTGRVKPSRGQNEVFPQLGVRGLSWIILGLHVPAKHRSLALGRWLESSESSTRGAIYHVMNRGDRWEPIFSDDQDRLLFLDTLAEAWDVAGSTGSP